MGTSTRFDIEHSIWETTWVCKRFIRIFRRGTSLPTVTKIVDFGLHRTRHAFERMVLLTVSVFSRWHRAAACNALLRTHCTQVVKRKCWQQRVSHCYRTREGCRSWATTLWWYPGTHAFQGITQADLATPAIIVTNAMNKENGPVGAGFVGWQNKSQIGYQLSENDQYLRVFLTYFVRRNSPSIRVINLL